MCIFLTYNYEYIIFFGNNISTIIFDSILNKSELMKHELIDGKSRL